jgi:hypothetical protein
VKVREVQVIYIIKACKRLPLRMGAFWQVKGQIIIPGAAWLEMAIGAAMTLNEAQDVLLPLLHKGSFVAALALPTLGSRATLISRADLSSGAISISSGSVKQSDSSRKLTHFTASVQSAYILSEKIGKQGVPTQGSRRHRRGPCEVFA